MAEDEVEDIEGDELIDEDDDVIEEETEAEGEVDF